MAKNDDRKIEALIRKNAQKVMKRKSGNKKRYDDTLPVEEEPDTDLRHFFSEMKKREF